MGALEAVKAAIVLVVGIVLGWLVAGLYAELVSLPAALEAGAQTERAVWETRQRAAEAKAKADRRAAQVRIDAIERDFHQREAERLAQLSNLEAAIEQETSRVPIPSSAARGAIACRPAVLPFLAACATRSTPSVAPRLATIPQALLLRCADVVALPERDLTTAETVRLWGADRQALGACRDRHDGLTQAARAIEWQGRAGANAAQ